MSRLDLQRLYGEMEQANISHSIDSDTMSNTTSTLATLGDQNATEESSYMVAGGQTSTDAPPTSQSGDGSTTASLAASPAAFQEVSNFQIGTSAKRAKASRPSLPKKPIIRCTGEGCTKKHSPPKTIDTTWCTACRNKKKTESTHVATVDAKNDSSAMDMPDDLMGSAIGKIFDTNVTDANSAKAQLMTKASYSVQVENDDFDQLDVPALSKEMLSAILNAPVEPPAAWDGEKKEAYRASQIDHFKKCIALLDTDEQVSDASARCFLRVEDAKALHVGGMLVTELAPKQKFTMEEDKDGKTKRKPIKPKTNTGFTMDIDIPCSQRVERMIKAVKHNKIVALDFLIGLRSVELVRCPTDTLRRKVTNKKINEVHHSDARTGGDVRREMAKNAEDTPPISEAPTLTRSSAPVASTTPNTNEADQSGTSGANNGSPSSPLMAAATTLIAAPARKPNISTSDPTATNLSSTSSHAHSTRTPKRTMSELDNSDNDTIHPAKKARKDDAMIASSPIDMRLHSDNQAPGETVVQCTAMLENDFTTPHTATSYSYSPNYRTPQHVLSNQYQHTTSGMGDLGSPAFENSNLSSDPDASRSGASNTQNMGTFDSYGSNDLFSDDDVQEARAYFLGDNTMAPIIVASNHGGDGMVKQRSLLDDLVQDWLNEPAPSAFNDPFQQMQGGRANGSSFS